MGKKERPEVLAALKVEQWLPEWNNVKFDEDAHRRRPLPHFFLFKMQAAHLISLSDIWRRTTEGRKQGGQDLGIQRQHAPGRSREIRKFIRTGFPLSDSTKFSARSHSPLQQPGWLPTAIVVNILTPDDFRSNKVVSEEDRIRVEENAIFPEVVQIRCPSGWIDNPDWAPETIAPMEIIDGQHRLLAFLDLEDDIDFELPVVAFYGLDISWQAYLFWVINIRPKRINPSLAFDLYPLLRTQSWLESADESLFYRETRAQELAETMWSHPQSPWHDRINMLGESGSGSVTQNAWIRSLTASYIKRREGRGISIGGLFGSLLRGNDELLAWNRIQQAAFLILVWQKIERSVEESQEIWAERLRSSKRAKRLLAGRDPAFAGLHSLLNTDQGVRAVLQVTNDMCFVAADMLGLSEWDTSALASDGDDNAIDHLAVSEAIQELEGSTVAQYLATIANRIAVFDWRTSAAESLTEAERLAKLGFRGSGGYKELRRQLLQMLIASDDALVSRSAQEVFARLGYDDDDEA